MFNPGSPQLKLSLEAAPKRPGVYIFRASEDESGEPIYIGKAVNLRNRSRSYFLNYKRLDPRLQTMVEQAKSVEYIEVDNEVEALLLETNLIKKYDPKFNIVMTDDKSYIFVKVDSDMDYPRVSIVREKKEDKADYFGPFPSKGPVRRMLRDLRKIFPYRSCRRVIEERVDPKTGETVVYSNDTQPCLYYHLGLCSAPCTTEIEKSDYRADVNALKKFFRSQHGELKKNMRAEMQQASNERNFERAAQIRDQLRDIDYLTKFTRITEQVDDVEFERRRLAQALEGVEQLATRLGLLDKDSEPSEEQLQKFRIECYDISNIQGTNATGSMVVAVGGKKAPRLYRKFKIKTKSTPDDFAMLKEVLDRRLKYLRNDYRANQKKARNSDKKASRKKKVDESFTQKPDLVVIDGGKGQLSSVLKILSSYPPEVADIPVIGLAKREEEVFLPDYSSGELKFKLVKFSKRSAALKLLQLVRDEAHRFGLGYHRLLRSKGMTYSELDLIPGVGEVTKKKLIQAFGSVEGIKKAKLEDIDYVIRNRSTSQKIKKLLV